MILNISETNTANAKRNSSLRVSQIKLQQELTGKSKTQVKREMKARDSRRKVNQVESYHLLEPFNK